MRPAVPPPATTTTIEATPQPQPEQQQQVAQPQQPQPTFSLEYDIADQTMTQTNVIPMIVAPDATNDANNLIPVTMELAYQTS